MLTGQASISCLSGDCSWWVEKKSETDQGHSCPCFTEEGLWRWQEKEA